MHDEQQHLQEQEEQNCHYFKLQFELIDVGQVHQGGVFNVGGVQARTCVVPLYDMYGLL